MSLPKMLVTKSRPNLVDGGFFSTTTEDASVFVMEAPTALKPVGLPFGSSTAEVIYNGYRPVNSTIKFRGKLYTWVKDVIRVYDPGTDLWTTAHTVSNLNLSDTGRNGFHSGFYFAMMDGTPIIFAVYLSNALLLNILRFNGITWSQIATAVGFNNAFESSSYGPGYVYENKLWISTQGTTAYRHILVDPVAGTATGHGNSPNDGSPRVNGCYVHFRGRMLGVFNTSEGGRPWYLHEYNSNTTVWTSIKTLQTGANVGSTVWYYAGTFAWATTDAVYVIISYFPTTDSTQFKLLKLTPTGAGTAYGEDFTINDISDPVLPVRYRSAFKNAWPWQSMDHHSYFWFGGFVDNSDPAARRVILYALQYPWDRVQTYGTKFWEFIDDSTELVDHGAGPTTAFSFPHSPGFAGGEYLWSDRNDVGKLDVVVEKLEFVNYVNFRISFRVRGGDGLTGRTVKLYFTTTSGQPLTACTLIDGSAGGGSATNTSSQITGVTDDGSVLHTVDWAASSQGITTSSIPIMAGTVE